MPGSLLICREARGPHWQLGPLPPAHGRVTIVGWTRGPDEHDGSISTEVARVLSRVLTGAARVTFASSEIAAPHGDTWSTLAEDTVVRRLQDQSLFGRALGKVKGGPSTASLIATRDADLIAERAFNDGGFPWWLQGQVLILSSPDAAPPNLDEPGWRMLIEDDWAEQIAHLAPQGVFGAVRPGVDGAVAGVLTMEQGNEDAMLDALRGEARRAGWTSAVVPESEL